MDKERKHRKAAMDQRTRARLPVLPALARTADEQRKAARARLDAALPAAPGQVVEASGEKLLRRERGRGQDLRHRPGHQPPAGPDPRGGTRFWAWATVEVLRATGIRAEELVELTTTAWSVPAPRHR